MRPLPCRNIAGPREPLLLEPHSQSVAFQSPGRPSRAPDTNSGGYRPSRVIRGLRPTSHVAIGTDPMTPTSYVRPPGRHSFRVLRSSARFRGTERRSIPLPADAGFSRFGTVSRWTHWQALASLSWLSSSSSRFLLHAIAGPVRPDIARRRATTPHASRVTRTLRLRAKALVPRTGFVITRITHLL